MTTIAFGLGTLGATGLGAGAAAALAGGALALGALGVAALAGGRRGGRRRGGGRRRHGRSLEDSQDVKRAMELIRVEDVTGCGLRLACDLGAKGMSHQLQETEAGIMDVIGSGVRPGEGLLPPGASGEYKAARGYGETGGDCSMAYPTCPFNGLQLMQVVNQYLP